MAALEASVRKAKEAREAVTPPPTSVADAKARKAAGAERAAAGKAASRAKASAPTADADAEEARPARRRKSA